MKIFMQIICLVCITSCSGLSLYSIFGFSEPESDHTNDRNIEPLDSEPFDEAFREKILHLEPEPMQNDQYTDINSFDEQQKAESASSVMKYLRSMLNSPVESTRKYAAKKSKELSSLLHNDVRKIVEFTLRDDQLLVDLGLKNSRIRSANIKEAKNLIDLIREMFSALFDYIASWFTWGEAEEDDKIDDKDHPKKDHDESNDFKESESEKSSAVSAHQSENRDSADDKVDARKNSQIAQSQSKDIVEKKSDEVEKPQHQNSTTKTTVNSDGSKDELKIEVHDGKEYVRTENGLIPKETYMAQEEAKRKIKESEKGINPEPLKNLTQDERVDVEKAQKRITILEEEINKIRQGNSHSKEDETRLLTLEEKLNEEKEFIRMSQLPRKPHLENTI